VACFATLGIGALLILVLMIAVDPYDSGRFGWLGIAGVTDKIESTADASRARDPHFDSAIFGDSTGQRPGCRRQPARALCNSSHRARTHVLTWRYWISSCGIIRASARW
jgi:hypothetical protein